MPKRKAKEDFEYLSRKLRKLERKIRRKRKYSDSSSSSSEPRQQPTDIQG